MKRLQEMNAKKEAAMIESVTNAVNMLAELRIVFIRWTIFNKGFHC